VHRGEVGQVALYDLSAELAQGLRALIFPADQGADLVSFVRSGGGLGRDGDLIGGAQRREGGGDPRTELQVRLVEHSARPTIVAHSWDLA
jgi:hypothetical protein